MSIGLGYPSMQGITMATIVCGIWGLQLEALLGHLILPPPSPSPFGEDLLGIIIAVW
jgi:hypothetical protein